MSSAAVVIGDLRVNCLPLGDVGKLLHHFLCWLSSDLQSTLKGKNYFPSLRSDPFSKGLHHPGGNRNSQFGWLVVLGLTALLDSISVNIGPSPKEREKEKRKDR